jgi:manganese oxidase
VEWPWIGVPGKTPRRRHIAAYAEERQRSQGRRDAANPLSILPLEDTKMWSRRRILSTAMAAAGAGLAATRSRSQEVEVPGAVGAAAARPPDPAARGGAGGPSAAGGPYVPVVTPNGATLPFEGKDGVKEFHLTAEPVEREFAPGMTVKCWGYNGLTPGPTIEAVEGDHVRILVTNRLPEATSIHWHGILLPNGMDGVSGLNQPAIRPGETFAYEFTLRQNGTQMYHPHADEMLQMAVGMMGMFVIHPREPHAPPVDRDFAIMLHEWAIHPGTYRPDPAVMTDFNMFSFNGKVYPGTSALVARTGERVRIRLANLSMDSHPIHLHGFRFAMTGTDGGRVPESAQYLETTVNVPVGATRDVEFIADVPGDWILHCHKSHHTMNAMAHDVPNTLGMDPRGLDERIRRLLPGYMSMGKDGMSEMQDMARHVEGPPNTLPMMNGVGPFGNIEMGGMFTILKVRDDLESYEDPGWYAYPPGTVAWRVDS